MMAWNPRSLLFPVAFVLGLLAACAEVPREAVTLSLTVQRDTAEIERANIALARQYFGRLRADANRFIDEVYGPAYIAKTLEYADTLNVLTALIEAENTTAAFQEMQVTVEIMVADLEKERQSLLLPIAAQEAEVVQAIEDAFGKVRNAQAIVTGHLASVRKVQEVQEELLSDAGLDGLRGRFIETTTDVSDKVAELIHSGRKASAGLTTAGAKFNSVSETLGKMKKAVRDWR